MSPKSNAPKRKNQSYVQCSGQKHSVAGCGFALASLVWHGWGGMAYVLVAPHKNVIKQSVGKYQWAVITVFDFNMCSICCVAWTRLEHATYYSHLSRVLRVIRCLPWLIVYLPLIVTLCYVKCQLSHRLATSIVAFSPEESFRHFRFVSLRWPKNKTATTPSEQPSLVATWLM